MKRSIFKGLTLGCAALVAAGFAGIPASAQEVTLRLHQFLPPQATVPARILRPWADSIAEATDGRLVIEQFDAMALGGRPPELMDQAIDGIADIVMTVVGYTPGRFPRSEVFELPFMMTDPIATSLAFQQMVEEDFQSSEYGDVVVLGAWVHGPGVIHTREGVSSLEDMEGLKLRGPTRIIIDMLSELGAEPVGMPLPAIPEALTRGVIDGTVIPWEVTPAIRLSELVTYHTEFSGDEALYTATIVTVMNRDVYDSLPEDLRAALDAASGEALRCARPRHRRERGEHHHHSRRGRSCALERGGSARPGTLAGGNGGAGHRRAGADRPRPRPDRREFGDVEQTSSCRTRRGLSAPSTRSGSHPQRIFGAQRCVERWCCNGALTSTPHDRSTEQAGTPMAVHEDGGVG